MHALRRPVRLAAAAGLVVLFGGGSGSGGSNSSVTFGISGAIAGATGVALRLTGAATGSTTTDANGNYAFGSLVNGNYTLTPSRAGYSFSPASIAVTVNDGDVTGQNFTASGGSVLRPGG